MRVAMKMIMTRMRHKDNGHNEHAYAIITIMSYETKKRNTTQKYNMNSACNIKNNNHDKQQQQQPHSCSNPLFETVITAITSIQNNNTRNAQKDDPCKP